MEKKRPFGITTIAVFFIILGLFQIVFTTLFLFAYKTQAPALLPKCDKIIQDIKQNDNLLEQKRKEYDSNKYNMLKQSYIQIKKAVEDYKSNYIYVIPRSLKMLALLFFLSAILFVYTGIIILRLNFTFKIYLILSFIVGLFNSLAFWWQLSLSLYLPVHVTDLVNTAIAIDKDAVLPYMHSSSDIFKQLFLQPVNAILYVFYFIFFLSSIFLFTRSKVKEQFK